MEISREIKDAENALREFTGAVLKRLFGNDWLCHSGISEHKIEQWKSLRVDIENQDNAGNSQEHLLFYAPLKDISALIKTHWSSEFHAVFGDWEYVNVYLKILNKYRNPDSARRELFIHEKHLVLGVTGEIRNRISAYRSFMELGQPGFPRIESIKDSFGNIWTYGKPMRHKTSTILKVGDIIEYVITATDPQQGPLHYRILGFKWETSNILRLEIDEKLIGSESKIMLTIKSGRKHHAFPLGYDDRVVFQYQVFPLE